MMSKICAVATRIAALCVLVIAMSSASVCGRMDDGPVRRVSGAERLPARLKNPPPMLQKPALVADFTDY
jgi:hypothetical protein